MARAARALVPGAARQPERRAARHQPWRPFVAELANDSERIEACSQGLREKYASARGSLAEMLLDEVLPTTLELKPA